MRRSEDGRRVRSVRPAARAEPTERVSEAHGGFYVNLSASSLRATPRPIDTTSNDSTQGREDPDDPSGLPLKLVGAEMGKVVVRVRLIERRDEQEMDLAS